MYWWRKVIVKKAAVVRQVNDMTLVLKKKTVTGKEKEEEKWKEKGKERNGKYLG